ncbi:NUDIX hydrolase [Butyrivibrio sp. XB500-5]|uniref:NUDIX hydrolase n=1 Tax=Butyrivibrio sp. XB500-5 TaxID=2364880 RepID=UPI000EAA6F1B|nr:NUDIX hydrolase [Butyrivibrio sp. XB500-5]RKM59566.1 NUDIX hydrolase [Butyrivibrio sp. XB500-5]
MNHRIQPWITKSSNKLLSTPFVSVESHTVELPNGTVIDDFYTVAINDAALIVATTQDDQIILTREYRYACKEVVTECPAGMVEGKEGPLITAKRELLEETGYESNDWTYLGPTFESTSKLTNTMHLFWAKDCKQVSEQSLEESEDSIEVLRIPISKAIDMVMDGDIKPNSSAHAILKVLRMMNK